MSAVPQQPSSSVTSLDRRIRMLRTAMGPLIAAALEDPDVVEVMLNPDGTLWIDRLSTGRAATGESLSAADGERIIRLVAAHVGTEVHRGRPLLTAELPETGERFEGILPPAAPGPAFALRKRAVGVIGLADYVSDGILSAGTGRVPAPRGARAPEHPDRRRHQHRQDHARQCAAGRDRQHWRPRAGAGRHGGIAVRGARPRAAAHPRRRGVHDRTGARHDATAARPRDRRRGARRRGAGPHQGVGHRPSRRHLPRCTPVPRMAHCCASNN